MDELDTQVLAEITSQVEGEANADNSAAEPVAETPAPAEEPKPEEKLPEPKMYDEATIKALRAENAKYRIRAREAEAKIAQQPYRPPAQQEYEQPYNQYGNVPQPTYDPRVDDMILQNKLGEIKSDPYFTELFKETNDLGETFEERLLEKAIELQWPVAELDALVFKMERAKLLGGVKQKGIDEAYKSMNAKAVAAPDRGVSSGKNVEAGDVKDFEDAFRRGMQEQGVTDLAQLR